MEEKLLLFIDDEKLPEWFGLPKATLSYRSSDEVISVCLGNKDKPLILYLDHDLGGDMNGADLLRLLIYAGCKIKEVFCISLNPIGVERIMWICRDHKINFDDIGRKVMFSKFSITDGQSG